MIKGVLYLVPNFLGVGSKEDIAPNSLRIIYALNEFIVESEKSARLFLKSIEHPVAQSDFVFHLLNEHSKERIDLTPYFYNCLKGTSMGLLSDAGIPCVADPGHSAVAFAHKNQIKIVPLSGPSSIYMALMASGFNGQSFAFHGYLPVENAERIKKIKTLEHALLSTGQTQLFMETPYRNEKLFELLLTLLKPNTKLCVAVNIANSSEIIVCKITKNWTSNDIDLHKKPALFLIGN